jgi:hypothetical protein
MTSKIKVDNIENQCGGAVVTKCGGTTTISGTVVKSNTLQASDAGNIISQSGTTITLGASGDTINLASGASQSGFGRTGTVDWQTGDIKTATFTAANGEGYFANTSGGAFTMNLPAGVVGAIVSVQDYNNTFDSNALTVDANGTEKINGGDAGEPVELNTEGRGVTFVYVDATVGWRSVQDNDFTKKGVNATFITATGGTVTCSGNFKIHTFTGPGTFTVCSVGNAAGSDSVDYLVVAGGGSGGASNGGGGGGGAGGFRLSNSTCMSAPKTSPLANPTGIPVTAQGYPIVIGAGGASVTGAGPSPAGLAGNNGSNSSAVGITSAGGGKGGGAAPTGTSAGGPGGSGGGEGAMNSPGTGAGSGNTPPVSPPQGNNGGNTNPGLDSNQGSGGGGAGAAGSANLTPTAAGPGGVGSFVLATGFAGTNGTPGPVCSARYFAGGGGANSEGGSAPEQGQGGAGGGGNGGVSGSGAPDGTANTGGAGGGIDASPAGQTSGIGGSGIVIIRYKFQ